MREEKGQKVAGKKMEWSSSSLRLSEWVTNFFESKGQTEETT
jgi:hypothetical protein